MKLDGWEPRTGTEMWRTSEDKIVKLEDKKGQKLPPRGQIEDYAMGPNPGLGARAKFRLRPIGYF